MLTKYANEHEVMPTFCRMFEKKEKAEKDKKPFGETGVGKFLKKAADVLPEVGALAFDFIGGPYEIAYDKVHSLIKGSNDAQAPALLREMSEHEKDFKMELEAINLEYYKSDAADRKDARDREKTIIQAGRTDWEKLLVLVIGLGISAFVVYSIVFIDIPEANQGLWTHLIGLIEGAILVQIYNYYFGSSKGSKDKTELLSDKS